jgi:hypothetical protein
MFRSLSVFAVVLATMGQPNCGPPGGPDLAASHTRRVPPPPTRPVLPAPAHPAK